MAGKKHREVPNKGKALDHWPLSEAAMCERGSGFLI